MVQFSRFWIFGFFGFFGFCGLPQTGPEPSAKASRERLWSLTVQFKVQFGHLDLNGSIFGRLDLNGSIFGRLDLNGSIFMVLYFWFRRVQFGRLDLNGSIFGRLDLNGSIFKVLDFWIFWIFWILGPPPNQPRAPAKLPGSGSEAWLSSLGSNLATWT